MVGRTPNSNSRESGLERASEFVDTRINISREFRILIFFFFSFNPSIILVNVISILLCVYIYIYVTGFDSRVS